MPNTYRVQRGDIEPNPEDGAVYDVEPGAIVFCHTQLGNCVTVRGVDPEPDPDAVERVWAEYGQPEPGDVPADSGSDLTAEFRALLDRFWHDGSDDEHGKHIDTLVHSGLPPHWHSSDGAVNWFSSLGELGDDLDTVLDALSYLNYSTIDF